MTDIESHSDRVPSRPRRSSRIKTWGGQTDAWRWNRRLNRRYVDNLLRARSATILPSSMKARILAMGIPHDIMMETLGEIRQLSQWTDVWIETAQRFLGDFRRQISGSQRYDAAQARMLAGLCYHIAQLVPGPDERTLDHCRGTAATLAGQAIPEIIPHARKVDISWRKHALPSILIPGPDSEEPSGLVVLFNGTSTIKEELLRWSGPFGQLGLATLLIDTPGTGEARHLGPPSAEHMDIMDGVFDMLRTHHTIDARKVGVLGISLGGNLALRCLAYDQRIAGVAMVTPPYDPARWIEQASPLVQDELGRLFQTSDPQEVQEIASSFSLEEVVPHIQRPTLIIGGGRDMVIPPSESTWLASQLGELSTLVWYPEGGHGLYAQIPAWTTDASYWFDAVQQRQSTRVDDINDLSEQWRQALYQTPSAEQPWDDSMESTRLLSPEEAAQRRDVPEQQGREYDDEYTRAFDEGFDNRRQEGSRAGRDQ